MRVRNLTSTAAVVALAFLALLSTGTHTVARGETLSEIAARYGTSSSTIAALNGLADPDHVRVGQVLTLPGASARPSGAATPAGGARHHVVRAGETISGIAARYGITQRQLIDANGLTGGVIYAGQRLDLVPSAATPAPRPGATTHEVAAGQTLASIAQRYGTTVTAIQQANGIGDPDRIVVGTVLAIPSTAGGSRSLLCPVRGRVRLMNDWGFPRSGGRFHEGNDLFAARGTPVVAVVGGSAAQRTGQIGGHQVTLRGDDGATYHYTHLDRFGTAGRVAAGTVLGYVGTSGNAAGSAPHLHFEVHPRGGAAVNPFPLIRPAC